MLKSNFNYKDQEMKRIITLLALSTLLLFSKTLVTVNGHNITDSLLSGGFAKLDETKKSALIEQLIKEEVLYANLLKSSLVNSQEFKNAFNKQKTLVEQQYGKKLNTEQLRSIKGAIAVALYQEKEFKKAKISKSEIKDFYQSNPQLFKFPNSIEIANIIVKDKKTADKIHKSLKNATNLDQAFLQAAHAQKQNGYMGWFGREAMPKNLFDKAFKYKKKRLLNAPVKTKHGYNIVYLLNKKSAGTLSFKEAKAKIEQMLKQKKVIEKLRTKVDNLYGQAEIVY
jgi:parvulin-like peptidyl-prolyl isomerase